MAATKNNLSRLKAHLVKLVYSEQLPIPKNEFVQMCYPILEVEGIDKS